MFGRCLFGPAGYNGIFKAEYSLNELPGIKAIDLCLLSNGPWLVFAAGAGSVKELEPLAGLQAYRHDSAAMSSSCKRGASPSRTAEIVKSLSEARLRCS